MKTYKNIFNLVIEGPDGVGKSTLIQKIFKKYDYRYMCYHRGEISNYFYSKKFNRPFYATQRGLPFLYIVLDCSETVLENRIKIRAIQENWNDEDLKKELECVKDARPFSELAHSMTEDYFIKFVDTTFKSENQVFHEVCCILDSLNNNKMDDEKSYSDWNKLYLNECKKLGKKFYVIDNQPYIDDEPIMVESTLHNGKYETFSNKTCYDNLIYSMSYGLDDVKSEKKVDFQYIINSKILRRDEVFKYYDQFEKRGYKFLTSEYPAVIEKNYKNSIKVGRVFGKDYINKISESVATVYAARDLEYLKLQTARLYEAIIANNIVFVDKDSDKDNEILKSIHGKDSALKDFLYVTPYTICERYEYIKKDPQLIEKILLNQRLFYNLLKEKVKDE